MGRAPRQEYSQTKVPSSMCTDSRPRARWYQLQGLPLVGSGCVFPQCNSSFVSHGEVPSHRRSNFASVSQELRRKQNKWNSRHSKFSNRHMPNGTTTAVQHPPKAHLGLPTTSWLRPSSFDKTIAVRTLGNDHVQQIVVSLITT